MTTPSKQGWTLAITAINGAGQMASAYATPRRHEEFHVIAIAEGIRDILLASQSVDVGEYGKKCTTLSVKLYERGVLYKHALSCYVYNISPHELIEVVKKMVADGQMSVLPSSMRPSAESYYIRLSTKRVQTSLNRTVYTAHEETEIGDIVRSAISSLGYKIVEHSGKRIRGSMMVSIRKYSNGKSNAIEYIRFHYDQTMSMLKIMDVILSHFNK